jgi:CRISPR/Cas system-associated exonuclease Cas4 (RecB family)
MIQNFHISLITGKIDLVETLELGRVRVTDFKTGSVKKKSEIEKETEDGHMSNYLRQLAMYSYLLDRTTKGDVAVVESQLEFLEAQKINERMYSTVVSPSMVEALRKDIMEFDSFLASGSWVDRECQFKAWKAGESVNIADWRKYMISAPGRFQEILK